MGQLLATGGVGAANGVLTLLNQGHAPNTKTATFQYKRQQHKGQQQDGNSWVLWVVLLLHFMICHCKNCHRPRTSSCHKEQRGGRLVYIGVVWATILIHKHPEAWWYWTLVTLGTDKRDDLQWHLHFKSGFNSAGARFHSLLHSRTHPLCSKYQIAICRHLYCLLSYCPTHLHLPHHVLPHALLACKVTTGPPLC